MTRILNHATRSRVDETREPINLRLVHRIALRDRLRVTALRHEPELAGAICRHLRQQSGILRVRWNRATCSACLPA